MSLRLPGRGSSVALLGWWALCSWAVLACGEVSKKGESSVTSQPSGGAAASGSSGDGARPAFSAGSGGVGGEVLSAATAGRGGNTAAAGAYGLAGGGSGLTGGGHFTGGEGEGGAESIPPAPQPYRALAVSVTLMHFCVLLDDHNIKCWGDNLYGQLGQENAVWGHVSEPQKLVNLGAGRTVQSVSVGRHASCALLDNGAVKCWGFAPQVGLNAADAVGDEPGEMGDNLPALDLGAGRTAKQLSLGSITGCAVLDDGNVRCWDLTLHDTFAVKGPPIVELAAGNFPIARFADGTLGQADVSERVTLPQGAHALQLAGEERQVCAVTDDGSVTCSESFWPPPALDTSSLVSIALYNGYGFCTLDAAGKVKCPADLRNTEVWAVPGAQMDPYGLIEVNLGAPAVALSGGGDHFLCALLVGGTVKCFGYPGYIDSYLVDGQLLPVNLGSH